MDPEIIKVQADISDINAKLDEVDQKFEKVEDSAKGMGQATEQSSKKAARGLDEVTSSLKKAEAEQKRLTNLIREQEKITGEFRQELIRLTRAYNDAGKSGTVSGLRIKKQMDQLNSSIKDQTVSVQQLKREQADQGKVVKNLKDQEKQLKKNGKEIDKTTKKTSKLEAAFKKLGSKILAAFAIQQLAKFAVEATVIADKARGVSEAFDELDNASLDLLRKSTKGLVNDLSLMTAAVKAEQFGVPMERLGELLQFAQIRARSTGQEVDYLVNSIVTGLGKKSTQILDDLGITSAQLSEALGGVGIQSATTAQLTNALADSLSGELEKGLTQSLSSTQRLTVIQDNLTLKIGQKLLPAFDETTDILYAISGALGIVGDDFSEAFDPSIIEDANKALAQAIQLSSDFGAAQLRQQGLTEDQIKSQIGGYVRAAENAFLQTSTVEELTEKVKELTAEYRLQGTESPDFLERIRAKIEEINKAAEVTNVGIVASYKERIKLAEEEIQAATSQGGINAATEKKIRLEKELHDILNAVLKQRKLIESFEADGEEPEELEFDQSFFEGFNRKADAADEANAKIEQSTNDLFDAELEAQQEAIQKKQENDEAYAAWKAEQDQLQADAYIGAMTNMFETFKILAEDNAEAQKAIAIFQAVINAYLAIQNALANVPYPANIVAAASIGILAFANVAKIASSEPPKFYDGTDYVSLNGNRPGKDTVHAMLNEGEGVVTTKSNRQFSGVVKSLNDGSFDKHYVKAAHVQAGLKALKKEQDQEKTALLTAAIKGTVNANLNDSRIVGELRRSRRVSEEMAYLLALQSNRKNPYRI